DVVKSAVALPQTDAQDRLRLRVLASAISVLAPVDTKAAQVLAKEGVRVETELIRVGRKPAVSVFSTGHVDCATTASFVEMLPAAAVQTAEEPLLRAITTCPRQTLELGKQKLEAAL